MVRPRTRRRNFHNPPQGIEDELARGPSGESIEGSNTLTLFSVVSGTQTPAPAPVLAPSSIEELYQQLQKTYATTVKLLEQNHGSGPCKQLFKARFPDLYYGNSL